MGGRGVLKAKNDIFFNFFARATPGPSASID